MTEYTHSRPDASPVPLPTPSPDTVDRIVDLAHVRMTTAQVIAPQSLWTRHLRRRAGVGLALAAAAASIIVVTGAFGPTSGTSRSVPGLGVEPAAADVVDAAARGLGTKWRSSGGELHGVRIEVIARLRVTSEQWRDERGRTREIVTAAPAFVPGGTTYWVPAEDCASLKWRHERANPIRDVIPAGEVSVPLTTLPVGAAAPDCWTTEPTFGEFTTVVGPVRASPPAGAIVEVHSLQLYSDDMWGGRMLRFGTEVREVADARLGLSGYLSTDPDPNAPRTLHPLDVPPATNWVPVRSTPGLAWSGERGDSSTERRPEGSRWQAAFTITDMQSLPDDASSVASLLRAGAVPDGISTSDAVRDLAAVQLGFAILQDAPIDHDVASRVLRGIGVVLADPAIETIALVEVTNDGPTYEIRLQSRDDHRLVHRLRVDLDRNTVEVSER